MGWVAILLQAAMVSLPGYAIGQPLEDARRVRPPGSAGEGWVLVCSGDESAPEQLAVQEPGAMTCWPMKQQPEGRVRTGYPVRGAERVEMELHLVNGIVERIETTRWYRNGEKMRLVRERG